MFIKYTFSFLRFSPKFLCMPKGTGLYIKELTTIHKLLQFFLNFYKEYRLGLDIYSGFLDNSTEGKKAEKTCEQTFACCP